MSKCFSLFGIIFLIFLGATSPSIWAEEDYLLPEERLVSEPIADPLEQEGNFAIEPYVWALRLGAGYSATFVDFEFERNGTLNGSTGRILSSDVDSGFVFPGFAFNFEVKFAMPEPFPHFAVGLAMDYRAIGINDLQVEFEGLGEVSQEDVANFHVISFIAFLEYRYPIEVGKHWLTPYARFGGGININTNTNDDLLQSDGESLALLLTIGVEYHLSSEMSVFFEPRWQYNTMGVNFTPKLSSSTAAETKFHADLDLSQITLMVGVNFYFGVEKRRE